MNPPTHRPIPPTSPPPFGRPEGHTGGSYDSWWWAIGRPAGMPYEPIIQAKDGYWVYGRGCTEPGGGIVPGWGFVPNNRSRVVGFGDEEIRPPEVSHASVSPSPWRVALVTTVLGAATGWVIDEVVRVIRGKKRTR